MNRVEVNAEEVPLPRWSGASSRFVRRVLETLDRDGWELSVLYCGDRFIRDLNARYRNRDEPTDILSFPQEDTSAHAPQGDHCPRNRGQGRTRFFAGDIVISLDTLTKNAAYFGITLDEELRRLLVHGILHLSGMDHASNEESEPMLQLQEKILATLGEERIIP
ncbi:MAG: rRNA maturation RNase YbeY [Treponema sp.]|jgi:probable rRNA maturation factor|nr:rRNA maturation RNase YbeY [Treponema sp.]